MAVQVDLRIEDDQWTALGDVEALCVRAIEAGAAKADPSEEATLDVLLTNDTALAALNAQWRGKEGATDVLSFPAEANPENFLGDIAIAYGICARDARQSQIAIEAHLSHLLIHGFLHLLGHDHIANDDADRMEALECDALASLGIANPYSRIA